MWISQVCCLATFALLYLKRVCLDLDIVATEGSTPNLLKRDEYPKWDSEAEGRGSLVWFNQASMIQSAELQYFTITEAKKKGLKTTTDFIQDADKYLSASKALTLAVSSKGS